jgi:DTW domain-containing protein YfiP
VRGLPFDETSNGRPRCYSCFRPSSHCVCDSVTPFTAHCNFLILQHWNERKKYHSTSWLTTHTIKNSKLLQGIVFEEQVLQKALAGQKNYILFPGPDSVDCRTVPFDVSTNVIVIDGTWSEAGKILTRNPILQGIPRISFHQTFKSSFYIRKQPKVGYLSTIESVGHLLKLNAQAFGLSEFEKSYDVLFEAFALMIEKQISHFPRMKGKSLEEQRRMIREAMS